MNNRSFDLPDGASTWIRKIEYEDNNLKVYFANQKGYNYHNVPEGLYDKMIIAESKGKFLHENLRGKFEGETID